ncbi:MAG: hypothetical protein GFH27_549305n208 [Chloroflexi bacterium AL-W]|nr:hypothetical protein [Chloroflexi bacterium AL-N1]NOK71226.1 hypothetical protein [Chloroflexi bacterium AL-N10]NOK76515.1 hypothetical protein [Chloroflexi bacterium AL-N5]NOK83632.1 hypothetical protein [Chloroflexi bacterium AL-W]NOK92246.1 hypothetical protein [Chloroflexi bacterium AL-N15]
MTEEKPWWWYSHVCIIFIVQTFVIGVLFYGWLLSFGEHWPGIGFGVMLGIPAAYYVHRYLLIHATQADTLHRHTRDAGRIILGGIILLYMLTLALQSEILGMIVMTLLISSTIGAVYGLWHLLRVWLWSPVAPKTTASSAHPLRDVVPLAETALQGAIDDPPAHTTVKGRIAEVTSPVAITGWVASTDATVAIEQIEVWIDGAQRGLATTDVTDARGTFSWQWDTTEKRPGIHTVVVRVVLSTGQTVVLPSARYLEHTHVLVQTGGVPATPDPKRRR